MQLFKNFMWYLSGDAYNTPKKMISVWKTWVEIYIGNNKEYDVKSYKIKKTVRKCTKLHI